MSEFGSVFGAEALEAAAFFEPPNDYSNNPQSISHHNAYLHVKSENISSTSALILLFFFGKTLCRSKKTRRLVFYSKVSTFFEFGARPRILMSLALIR